MARFDLVVRNGSVAVNGGPVGIDVGIRDGRILALEARLDDAEAVLDAGGRLVLPGGVDSHCHMDQPAYGAACADDFDSGSLAAMCGGTTTIIPFAMAGVDDFLPATVSRYRALAENKSLIDYAIHPTIQATPTILIERDLPELIADGYASVKLFTTYDGFRLDDAQLIAAMACAARAGAAVMVHAENDALIAHLTRDLVARGCHAPRFHSQARPPLAESEAINRIAAFAAVTGARVLIVHVSSQEGLDEVRRAQARGIALHAETCPQYLFLSQDDLDRPLTEAARFVCSPPLRSKADQDALWSAMIDGTVTIYSSDHSPSRLDGPDGKLRNGAASRFDQIANGLPGVELRLPLLFSEGYLKGRMDLGQFVDLTSRTAAEFHGIAPHKGSIAVGADADLAIWDADRETTVSHKLLHDRTGYTPYEGMRIRGWPVTTLSRGEIVVDDGRVLASPGRGRFVPSKPRVPGSACS